MKIYLYVFPTKNGTYLFMHKAQTIEIAIVNNAMSTFIA